MFALKILIANLAIFLLTFDENEWKLSLDKDNIIIYTRKTETSRFKEFLAEAKMDGTIEDFKRVITDIAHYTDWIPDCKSAEIIENPNPKNITYHVKLKVPFPFANRDIVQQIVLYETDDKLEVIITNHPKKVKKEKSYVRMPGAEGKWIIEKISENQLSIRFQYLADPGGDIPAWLVNSFIVKNPHLTMVNIRELLAE